MKIGILNASLPVVNGIRWDTSPVDAYIHFFESVQASFEYAGYNLREGEFPSSPAECDAYVITGSVSGVYDTEVWIADLSVFIRDCFQAGRKLVGICFGHQILAHSLGGHAEKSEKGRGLGQYSITLSHTPAWMHHPPAQLRLYYMHQDQVMTLPPQAELLGGNDFCPNALFAIDSRVLGIQGHPEFTSAFMREVLLTMEATVPPQTYQAALQSLQNGEPDNHLVGTWIVAFLLGA